MNACRAVLAVVLFTGSAFAHDGHIAQLPPGKGNLGDWIASLRSKNNTNCCSEADGFLVELFWEANGKYRVKHEDKWYDVLEGAVIEVPNLAGRAMVWWNVDEDGNRSVRCFISGDLT